MMSPEVLSPDEQLLVTLAQRRDVRVAFDQAAVLLEQPTTRLRFVRLAKEHGIHGLIVSVLLGSPVVQSLSAQVAQELAESWNALRRQAVLWDLERDRVLLLLERNGLAPLMLKGGALRETVYAQSAERSVGDLDMLLSPEQAELARTILEGAGYRYFGTDELRDAYRRHHFHYRLDHPNGFTVEIHWALSHALCGFELDGSAFLARAVERHRTAGPVLRVPSPEDMILHLVSQNAEDAFGRLRRLVDLDRVVAHTPGLDWAYLQRTALASELQVLLGLSLRLAQLLLRTPVPRGFVESLALASLCRANVALLRPVTLATRMPAERRAAATEVLMFWATAGWRNRLRRLWLLGSPNADPLLRALRRTSESGHPDSVRQGGLVPLVKVTAYQLWVYSAGLVAALTPSGRRALRFWADSPGSA